MHWSGAPVLRLPRPTARLRLTLFYSSLFLVSGAGLLAITYLLIDGDHGFSVSSSGPGGGGPGHPVAPGLTVGSASLQQSHGLTPQQVLIQSGIALAIMAVAAVGLGWLVAGRVLRPLRTINTSARRISAGNLHERLPLPGPDDEFSELTQTLNGLLGRLEASFAAQRHFVANASHELRTPLTVERTLLQVALADPDATTGSLRAVCEKLLASGRQQEHLIDALLTLASTERGLDRQELLDLAAQAAQVLKAHRRKAQRLNLRISAYLSSAPAVGDPDLVECLVSNLVSNAMRYNNAGGWVNVATSAGFGAAILSVSNSGPVVPAEEIDRLFQPFQRLTGQRAHHPAGHGLGLAIVQAIATSHGAHVRAHPGESGGLEIEVRFPPNVTTSR